MTDHFNQLTEAESERLTILAEECSEVIQAVCKVQRHGWDGTAGRSIETNRQGLERECGDLLHALDRLMAGDLDGKRIAARKASRPGYVAKYLHHQES